MFESLQKLDYKLYNRYLTLEKNIKADCNSFYDAYLDMQEQFVKLAIADTDINISAKDTCGMILRKSEVRQYFLKELGIEEYTYSKMQDYSLKVNSHKHNGEKRVQVETIVSYLKILYSAISAYAKIKGIEFEEFDANYFESIYNVFEEENINLKLERDKLKEDLRSSVEQKKLSQKDIELYKQIVDKTNMEKLTLEEQNATLQKQISQLKDIKLFSMEDKLNKTIDLLNNLTESVVENRAISYAVGDTICGSDAFQNYVKKAKESLQNK